MIPRAVIGVFFAAAAAISPALAQPPIISENAQEIASEIGLARELGIEWSTTSAEDVETYLGILAAVEVAAQAIADEFGMDEPERPEYLTAFSLYCIWPPNKPPVVAEYRKILQNAYNNRQLRERIPSAIGPYAFKMADFLHTIMPTSDINQYALAYQSGKIDIPSDTSEYKELFFNFDKLQ